MSKDSPVITEVVHKLHDGGQQYYLKEGDGTVATILVLPSTDRDLDYEVKGLWINPEYRRMGFARSLINRVLRDFPSSRLAVFIRSDYGALMLELGLHKTETIDKWVSTDNAHAS